MRLKSLSLFGFKSFAERTELIFPQGITAIVGPNGSGKSNIIDAIVWVLGERSSKAIRSLKASDLLFTGNGKIKPASLAEVSLTLELDERNSEPETRNTDELFAALSELVIARRLKRSGESQFIINRVPCRLRDVQDLLLRLGLSADSYSIVGQAEIDRLVFLSPQERRALIEQVAGVHRFQLRRADSLDRLERTERNLTRLRDLLAELKRQSESLRTEVEKARRCQQLLKRQRELQIALLGWEHQVRLKRVERLQQERTTLKQAISKQDEQIAQVQAERQETDAQLAHMEESLQALQEQMTQALEEAKALENELALCAERRSHLNQRLQQIKQQTTSLTERRKRLLAELSETQKRLETLSSQFSAFSQQETTLEAQRNEAQQVVADFERKLKDAYDAHFESERALAEGRSQLSSLEPLLQSLRAREVELRRELVTVQERLTQIQQQYDELVIHHSSIATDELTTAMQRLQAQLAERLRKVEVLRHQLNETRERLVAARARLATLEEMELSLVGVPQGARVVLLSVREGKLKGEFHLLAHLLRVPNGLEVAYENALGAAANYLIAPTFTEVQTAIEFLKTANAGRATFLALDFLSELNRNPKPETRNPVNAEGVIGWADELVQVTGERFAQAVRHVLRNTLLVEDLKTARKFAPQMPSIRFVTRSGEVIAPSGTISGGSTVQGTGGIFLRQREREELTTRIRRLEGQTRELETQLQTAEQQITLTRDELTKLQRQHEERERLNERLRAEQERIQTEMERWRREQQRGFAEEQRLQREIHQLQREAEERAQQLQRLTAERNVAQERIRELQAALAKAVRHRDEVNQQWQQAKMSAAQWQAQQESLKRRLDELTEGVNETERQVAALAQESETLTSEIAGLTEQLPKLERQLSERHRLREQAEASLTNWHEHRRNLSQRRDELEQQLKTLTEQRSEQAEELHRCELRLTQGEAERAEIERRLTEEFGVPLEIAHEAAKQLEQKQTALDELERLKQEMAAMGEVRLGVLDESERLNERITFLQDQIADLEAARAELLGSLETLEQKFKESFREVLEQVSDAFNDVVQRFWKNGGGWLILTEAPTLAESGVEVKVHLPDKPEQDLIVLSGGERAIVGLCLLFAFLKINPTPFVLLDEVDASLDDSNTERFTELLHEFSDRTQFIVITHNPITIQAVEHLYGVTMEERGISKVLSLSLKEALAWTERS